MNPTVTGIPTEGQRSEYIRNMLWWGKGNLPNNGNPHGPSIADCLPGFTKHLEALGHTPRSYMLTLEG